MRTLQRTLIGLVVGLLLGSVAIVEGQSGPYAAQIQSALRSLGLSVVSGTTKITQAVTVTCAGSTSGTTYAPTTFASTGICTFGQQGDTGALYMTYNTVDNVGVLGVLSPGTAWRALFINPGGGDVTVGFGSRLGFSPSNTVATGDTFFTRGGAAGKMVLTGTTPMFQLGGTTSSFPALKQSSANFLVRKADDSGNSGVIANSFTLDSTGTFSGNLGLLYAVTAPSAPSSCGASPAVTSNNGTAAWVITGGTGGAATGCTVTMPTATTGWNCSITNITATAAHRANVTTVQTASTTTSVTWEYQTVSTGAATIFTASDVFRGICFAY